MIHSPLNKWLATVALITSVLEASSEPKAQDEALDILTEENKKVKNQNVSAREAVEATKQTEKERVKEYFKDHLNDSHAGDLAYEEAKSRPTIEKHQAEEYDKFLPKFKIEHNRVKAGDQLRYQTASNKKQTYSEEVKEHDQLIEKFAKDLGNITKAEINRPKILLQFDGGAQFSVRKDIISLTNLASKIENNEKELKINLDIKPSILKRIIDFLEASLTKGSRRILVNPETYSKYTYPLFIKSENLLKFVKTNKDLIYALEKLDLFYFNVPCGKRYSSQFDYSYPPNRDSIKSLIFHQLEQYSSLGFHSENPARIKIILNLLPRIDEAKYTALEHAFGALSRDMNREFSGELIRTLNQADPVYFQEITSIVNSLMEGLRDRRNLDFKYNLISAITRLNPDLYPFIQNFLTDNPAFLR